MEKENIQSSFLDEIRSKIPSSLTLADELSEILCISRDSAYRRIRGETVLSLDEAKKLCIHYNLSLDNLMLTDGRNVSFNHWPVDHSNFTLRHWLESIAANLSTISSFPQKKLFYSAKDLPIFNYFNYPELSCFKIYFWMKSVLRYPKFQHSKFEFNIIPNDYISLGKTIWDKYMLIPSVELWSEEAVNVTLKQIEFCYESGLFKNPKDAQKLCDQYLSLVQSINHWAELGVKGNHGSNFSLYKNEILIGDNILFFKANSLRKVFIAYNTMSVITTSQESFCDHIEDYLNGLLNKSIMISTVGEKERNKFFNQTENKITHSKSRIT